MQYHMSCTSGSVDDVMLDEVQIRAIGKLVTLTRQLAPGSKSAIIDCLVESCRENLLEQRNTTVGGLLIVLGGGLALMNVVAL